MKKIYKLAILASLVLSIQSCYKDKGNYDYAPSDEIKIEGVSEAYDVITEGLLEINPIVTPIIEGTQYDYMWVANNDILNLRDTLSYSKNLSVNANLKPSTSWQLYFYVINHNTQAAHISKYKLSVSTLFTRGWYVFKSIDENNSDYDLHVSGLRGDNLKGTVVDSIVNIYENILTTANGRGLKGKAQKTIFTIANCFTSLTENGLIKTAAYNGVMVSLTDKDMALTIRGNDPVFNYTADNIMFDKSIEIKPQFFSRFSDTGIDVFINGGKFYSYATSPPGTTGRFSSPVKVGNYDLNYNLSKYAYLNWQGQSLCYDETNGRFLKIDPAPFIMPLLDNVGNASSNAINANDTQRKLLYMGSRSEVTSLSPNCAPFAIMERNSDGGRELVNITYAKDDYSLTIKKRDIATSEKLSNGTHFTMGKDRGIQSSGIIVAGPQVIYFYSPDANAVYMVPAEFDKPVNEQKMFDIPTGEELSFIRHRISYNETTAKLMVSNFNYVIIGTKIGTRYRIRFFTQDQTTGVLTQKTTTADGKPWILEGDGEAADVWCIFPDFGYRDYAEPGF